MKNIVIFFSYMIISVYLTGVLTAQTTSAVVTTSAGASLVEPMTITQESPLSFGTFSTKNASGGTILLPSNSTNREFTGSVVSSPVSDAPKNAAYRVSGTKNQSYSLTLPIELTISEEAVTNGEATMIITDLKARFKNALSDGITSTLSDNGTDSFTIGGTLLVGHGGKFQADGVYTGTFDVTVDYN